MNTGWTARDLEILAQNASEADLERTVRTRAGCPDACAWSIVRYPPGSGVNLRLVHRSPQFYARHYVEDWQTDPGSERECALIVEWAEAHHRGEPGQPTCRDWGDAHRCDACQAMRGCTG